MLARTGVIAALSVFASLSGVRAGSYGLAETSVGSSFYTNFLFDAISDPTHGRVVYVALLLGDFAVVVLPVYTAMSTRQRHGTRTLPTLAVTHSFSAPTLALC